MRYLDKDNNQVDCYYLPRGHIDSNKLKKHTVNGKVTCCGRFNNFSIVAYSRENHDSILVSAVSEEELITLAAGS